MRRPAQATHRSRDKREQRQRYKPVDILMPASLSDFRLWPLYLAARDHSAMSWILALAR